MVASRLTKAQEEQFEILTKLGLVIKSFCLDNKATHFVTTDACSCLADQAKEQSKPETRASED